MDIKGLDYNTGRNKLILPEYGREIQKMIEYCKTLPEKSDRQNCAEVIIDVMMVMTPHLKGSSDYLQKLWDHLAIMSNFELDIDYPFEVTSKESFLKRPEPLQYPMQNIRQRHYGHLLEECFTKLEGMKEGEERDELVRLIANQMKRTLFVWNRGDADEEKIADDMARYTHGNVQMDLSTFQFAKIDEKRADGAGSSKKKKKKN